MKKLRYFLTGFLLTVAGVGAAATFNLFQPATGILKGNASTYVTTAAASTDVISLWSGTCNASTFLKGDGSCAAPPPTGVTSVGLTMPSGFSVTGSPVTSTGTLAVSTTLNGPLRGNGSGLVTGNIALGSEVSGTLGVANGGTGVATLTGIAKGNGTSAFTAAASTDVISLWSGTCDATTFLRGDGSCEAAGGSAAGSTGQLQYNNAGAFAAVSSGTAGQILTSNGVGIAPSWEDAGGGGAPAPIICTSEAFCDVTAIELGQFAIALKTSDTARNGTTRSADPTLRFLTSINHRFAVEALIIVREQTAIGGGYSVQWIGAGSSSNDTGQCIARATASTTATPATSFLDFGMTSTTKTTNDTWPDAFDVNYAIACKGYYIGGSAIQFSWAQGASVAHTLTVRAGSWVRLQRIN